MISFTNYSTTVYLPLSTRESLIAARTKQGVVKVSKIFTMKQSLLSLAITYCLFSVKIVQGGRDEPEEASDSRIVGGRDAEKGRYPTIVAMYDQYGFFQCGGSLILPDVVLSAAHCATVVERVEVGRYDLSQSVSSENAVSLEIVEKQVHPDYGEYSLYKNDMDFALFKLSSKVANAKTATLNADPGRPRDKRKTLTVAGWGTTSEGGTLSNKLQEVEVKYMTNDVCKSEYSAYSSALTDDMMCANIDGGGKVSLNS